MFTIKLFLSIIPIIVIANLLYKIDKDKEPSKVLINIFVVSVVVGLIGGLFSSAVDKFLSTLNFNSIFVYNVVRLLFVIALTEEVCKFIPAKFIGMNSKYHSSFYDTLIYFAFSGLGFACIENIMYVMTFTVKTALVRGILSVPGHILFSVLLGIFIALANREKQKNNNKSNEKSIIYTTLGFTIASVTHALYNYGLAQNGLTKAIIVFIMYIVGIYLIFIIKEVSRVNTFYIKDDIFKEVLKFKYIKANRKIIGIVSSIIIILGILNTFSVYVFVEKYISLKYILIGIQTIIILLLIYKKKLINKFKYLNITNIGLYIISIILYVFLLCSYLKNNNSIEYGYSLALIGIITQTTYFILDNIKLNNKKIITTEEQINTSGNTAVLDEIIDSEII